MSFIEQFKASLLEVVNKYKAEKFVDVKAQDGSILRYTGETPEVGMPINIITEEGELPAPDGDYTLEDGSVIFVKDGVVAEVKPVAAEEEKAPENPQDMNEPAKGSAPVSVNDVKSIVESIVKEYRFSEVIEEVKREMASKFEAIENENATLKSELEKSDKFQKDIFAIVEKIAAEPSEPKEEKKRDGFLKRIGATDEKSPWEKELEEARKLLGKK